MHGHKFVAVEVRKPSLFVVEWLYCFNEPLIHAVTKHMTLQIVHVGTVFFLQVHWACTVAAGQEYKRLRTCTCL